MATKLKRKNKIQRSRKRASSHLSEPHGLIFRLCCGDMTISHGHGKSLGIYRVDFESHGVLLTLLFNEKQASDLALELTECVTEARKLVN
jgi:hypothetical protein